jgi:hypothetical protein
VILGKKWVILGKKWVILGKKWVILGYIIFNFKVGDFRLRWVILG